MSSMHSVAIIGGTGGLGQHISEAFLTDFRASFPTVKVLSRDPASAKAKELADRGAELFKLDDSASGDLGRDLGRVLAGTDVIVNALPGKASDAVKRGVVEAAAGSAAKVYFVSEYGSDHRINDFPGYEHPYWSEKQELVAQARNALKGKKVIALFTSIFMQLAFSGPFLGYDLANNTYTVYGSPTQAITFTATEDIGRAIARISVLALDPTTATQVPDDIRIAGQTVTTEEIRDIVARVRGIEKGKVVAEDLAKLQNDIKEHPGENFVNYLLAVIGEGKADFSSENDDELINPGEKIWKWKTLEEHIRAL